MLMLLLFHANAKDVSAYLNRLRESDVTNMYGAATYVAEEFDLEIKEAKKFHTYWRKNFEEEKKH